MVDEEESDDVVSLDEPNFLDDDVGLDDDMLFDEEIVDDENFGFSLGESRDFEEM